MKIMVIDLDKLGIEGWWIVARMRESRKKLLREAETRTVDDVD